MRSSVPRIGRREPPVARSLRQVAGRRILLGDMGDFGAYLASIDFRLAVLLAAVLVVIAAVVRQFVLAATDEGLAALPLIGGWLARAALARRRHLAIQSWFCTTCRSLNPPSATYCYRGCGPREEREADGLPTDAPVEARAGTSRRRG